MSKMSRKDRRKSTFKNQRSRRQSKRGGVITILSKHKGVTDQRQGGFYKRMTLFNSKKVAKDLIKKRRAITTLQAEQIQQL